MIGSRSQPQGLLRLGRAPIAQGQTLSILPGVNRAMDAVSGVFPATLGTKKYYTAASVSAAFGAALGVAASDRVTTPLIGAFPSATGRTYFFRGRRNGAGGANLGRLFDKTSGATGQFLYWSSATGLNYGFYTGAGTERAVQIAATNSPLFATGEWFDVEVSHRDEGAQQVVDAWVNGAQVVTGIVTPGANRDAPSAPMVIGNRGDGLRNWDGLIECAYVWDRILGPSDVPWTSQAPYQGYFDPAEDEGAVVAAAPDISLNIGWLEQSETFSAAVSATTAIRVQWAEQDEAVRAYLAGHIAGGTAWVESDESARADASIRANGTISWLEQDDVYSARVAVTDPAVEPRLALAWLEQGDNVEAIGAVVALAAVAWMEQSDSSAVQIRVGTPANLRATWTEQGDAVRLRADVETEGDIDALLVPPRQTIMFEGSRRVVAFEGGKRVVSFEGSKRLVEFP